jgi:hypothetical protein
MRKLALLIVLLLPVFGLAQTTQLTVRAFSEGYYRLSMGRMVAVIDSVNFPNLCDTGFIQVIDTTSDQAVFCTDVVIKTDGYGYCNVPAYLQGQYFQISMKFKNTFHVLSKNQVRMSGNAITVDLTVPQNVCCGFDSTGGVAKAFSGELNEDGAIDGSDYLILDPDIQNHRTGYALTDLNGDHTVDTMDFQILDINISMGRWEAFVGTCMMNGINEKEKSVLKVFPNPFKDILNIQSNGDLHFILTDMTGRICRSGFEYGSSKIETMDVPVGAYLLKVISNDKVVFHSIVLKVID